MLGLKLARLDQQMPGPAGLFRQGEGGSSQGLARPLLFLLLYPPRPPKGGEGRGEGVFPPAVCQPG